MLNRLAILLLIAFTLAIYSSCSKSGSDPAPSNPCSGVTVNVTGTTTNASSGQSNGSITATATGGSGFTFSINGTTFQATGTFSNLSAGNYTVTAKNINGCTGTQTFTVGTLNTCAGVNINVGLTATPATPCLTSPNGSITVAATGSTNFTYSINGTTFQASDVFNNVASGNYTVTVKDGNGCSNTGNVTVGTANAGALFLAVKTIIASNCVGCHNSTNPSGGNDWTVDCNIVSKGALIKIKAVDQAGTPNQMPPPPNPALSASDRQKIVDWLAAGGGYHN
jgi:hypothetical protein